MKAGPGRPDLTAAKPDFLDSSARSRHDITPLQESLIRDKNNLEAATLEALKGLEGDTIALLAELNKVHLYLACEAHQYRECQT